MKTKKCNKCLEEKDICNFRKKGSICKICMSAKEKAYRQTDKYKQRIKKYYAKRVTTEKIFIEEKKCTRCSVLKSRDEFSKCSRSKDGLLIYCKDCAKSIYNENGHKYVEKNKEWVENNRDKVRENHKRWCLKNQESIRVHGKKYKLKNSQKNKNKIYNYEDKKFCHKCNQEKTIDNFHKTIRNKDGLGYNCKKCHNKYSIEIRKKPHVKKRTQEALKIRKNSKKPHITEKICTKCKQLLPREMFYKWNYGKYGISSECSLCKEIQNKAWRKNNMDRVRKNVRKAKHTRKARELKLESTLTEGQWQKNLLYFNNSCAYCGGGGSLEQDHIIPVTKKGPYVKWNIIPACKSCNCSKGNKDLREFVKDPSVLLKIHEFLRDL